MPQHEKKAAMLSKLAEAAATNAAKHPPRQPTAQPEPTGPTVEIGKFGKSIDRPDAHTPDVEEIKKDGSRIKAGARFAGFTARTSYQPTTVRKLQSPFGKKPQKERAPIFRTLIAFGFAGAVGVLAIMNMSEGPTLSSADGFAAFAPPAESVTVTRTPSTQTPSTSTAPMQMVAKPKVTTEPQTKPQQSTRANTQASPEFQPVQSTAPLDTWKPIEIKPVQRTPDAPKPDAPNLEPVAAALAPFHGETGKSYLVLLSTRDQAAAIKVAEQLEADGCPAGVVQGLNGYSRPEMFSVLVKYGFNLPADDVKLGRGIEELTDRGFSTAVYRWR